MKVYRPFGLSAFVIMTVVAIITFNVISGLIGILTSQQMEVRVLLLIVAAAVIIPFMVIQRAITGVWYITVESSKDLMFVLLSFGFVLFLMSLLPSLFNLPEIFSAALINLFGAN